MPEDLSGIFRKPFPEQVAALRLRFGDLRPTARWDDLTGAQHDRAFMVAGAVKADLLADLAAAVDRVVAEGGSLEDFRRDFRDIVERHGWHGWTGEGTKKGEAWRTRVIYRTNVATTYSAGRLAQMREAKFPLWVYRHSGAEHPRLDHLSWDGLVLPADDPFWAAHYPPNGWGCGCRVAGARSMRGAIRLGGKPGFTTPPSGWDSVDPRTGTPPGIGKGWDHAPGDTVSDTIATMTEKTIKWEHVLAKEFMASLPAGVVDDFASGYRQLPSLRSSVGSFVKATLTGGSAAPADAYKTLGRLTSAHVEAVRSAGFDVAGFDFNLEQDAIRHVASGHFDAISETARGQSAVTVEDFANLASHLDFVTAIEAGDVQKGQARPSVVMKIRVGNQTWTVVFEIRRRRKMLVLKTMFKK
ncbi:phage Mu protein F like protein [Defluviimonas denitrificans]|uniref:Phage Mu protein F like protein n=1 Tax=Albidovulum denitrificans TaxID=404881 RepID=A0A2S8S6F4_9RHOB|nr:phage minor head protein [Defluviimonas denitrificans]PQV56399.1 phage Mu protein F like protein [Defluviimonas denitrificans]